jgi:hypothetical protein
LRKKESARFPLSRNEEFPSSLAFVIVQVTCRFRSLLNTGKILSSYSVHELSDPWIGLEMSSKVEVFVDLKPEFIMHCCSLSLRCTKELGNEPLHYRFARICELLVFTEFVVVGLYSSEETSNSSLQLLVAVGCRSVIMIPFARYRFTAAEKCAMSDFHSGNNLCVCRWLYISAKVFQKRHIDLLYFIQPLPWQSSRVNSLIWENSCSRAKISVGGP